MSPRLDVRLPLYVKAAVQQAASFCGTDVGNLVSVALAKLADPRGEDPSEREKSDTLSKRLVGLYLGRKEDEQHLAVRGQEEVEPVTA